MHIPKLLKEELGGGNKEFSLADGELYNKEILSKVFYSFFNSSSGGHFVNIEDAEKFLTSADRQSILLHFLNSIRAEKEDVVGDVTFREGEAIGEILSEIRYQTFLFYNLFFSVPKCLSKGVLWQIYPLHDNICLENLQKTWVKQIFGLQPLGRTNTRLRIKTSARRLEVAKKNALGWGVNDDS